MLSSSDSSDHASGPSRAQLPAQLQQLSSELSELAMTPPGPEDYDEAGPVFSEPVPEEELPDDIVQSMTTEWQRLQNKNRRAVNRGQDSAKAYNLETFLIKWVRGHMGAQHLAAALRDPRVKEALETAGIKITDTQEEDGDVFRSSTIRKEMKALLTTDPFNDFKPYAGQDDNAATIADFCSTS